MTIPYCDACRKKITIGVIHVRIPDGGTATGITWEVCSECANRLQNIVTFGEWVEGAAATPNPGGAS